MIKLPDLSAFKALIKLTLHPRTKWGRVTLWSGGLCILLYAIGLIFSLGSNAKPGGWTKFFALIFTVCALRLIFRWMRRRVMWRLRYRLIVTYLFIAVIPVLLLLTMVGVSYYLFAGQFADYAAITNLQSALRHLEAENEAMAARWSSLSPSGLSEKSLAEGLSTVAATMVSADRFPGRTVTVWQGNECFTLTAGGALVKAHPAKVPDSIKDNFSSFVLDGDQLHLRAVKRFSVGGEQRTLISDLPISKELLHAATALLGSATLVLPARGGDLQIPAPAVARPNERRTVATARLAPSSSRFDPDFSFPSLFQVLDWDSGKKEDSAIIVVTRPSLLYSVLFANMGDNANVLRYVLVIIAILLGLVELAALYIGIRLTRSMTRSVAELYKATEHVNRGDLTHRIQIRGHDQLAALEQSFNSMTDSLVELAAEQKRRQQIENELAIAYEVQEALFPHKLPQLASLEVYGVCRPARLVSGDYYDFIPMGRDRLVLAVGDISGKGISAALLMATTHAFVRAYSLPRDRLSTPAEVGAALRIDAGRGNYFWEDGVVPSRPSVGMMMSTLNSQLFHCTAPEKYATMFLSCYDEAARELTYCNAGHLPPILLGKNGSISRLEASGTVVGLFDHETYGESTVVMQPGDLVVAYSDGVTEPENDSGEFGEERLIALLREHRHRPLPEIGDAIAGSVVNWIGDAEQPDDVTIVLMRAR
jgi:sigma-B regulation protein RsbU (phosphoserine phosphatase)